MAIKLNIRKAIKNDFERICSIGIEAFSLAFINENNRLEVQEYVQETYNLDSIEQQIKANKEYFVAEADKSIIGFIQLSQQPPYQNSEGKFIKIERLYLDPNKIGNGFGWDLMSFAEDYGKKLQADHIWLEVLIINHSAVRFYEKFGLKQFDSNPGKFKSDNELDLWMKKSIQ